MIFDRDLIVSLGLALAMPAFAQPLSQVAPGALPPDSPLVVDGEVRVVAADFEGNILRIPANRRTAFRMSHERVASVIDNVYISRTIAQKARDAGMDQDPAVQARLRQVQDGFLAELYFRTLESDANYTGIELRARELYIGDPGAYMTDEEVQLQQILVGTKCRTKEAALEIARRAHAEASDGKGDFIALAARFSDADAEKGTQKSGDLGWGSVKPLSPSVREAVAKMKKGEISQPVETPLGFHVLKLVDRKPAQPKPFEEVKEQIIATERTKQQTQRREDIISRVRSSTTVVTYPENVGRLVAAGQDLDDLTRRAKDRQARPEPQSSEEVTTR